MTTRIFLSSAITILSLLSFVGIFFQNRWSSIAALLLILLAAGVFLSYKKNVKIVIVFLFALLLSLFFFVRALVPAPQTNSVNSNNTQSTIQGTQNDNVENRLQEFTLLVSGGAATQNELNQSLASLISFAESKVDNNNPKSYQDLGKVYEVAMILGVEGADQKAADAYNSYCEFDLNNPECYATLAKFVGLDETKKAMAAALATKAMELAKTSEDVLKYNQLVDYFSK